MRRLIVQDAGPLFSLAAGDALETLLDFEFLITDVIKTETIDRGRRAGASVEARTLYNFYRHDAEQITIRETQFGGLLAAARRASPRSKFRNAGELSIQSLLIELAEDPGQWEAIVLFEDNWFVRHAVSFPPQCRPLGTSAFLTVLERLGFIDSATEVMARIQQRRNII